MGRSWKRAQPQGPAPRQFLTRQIMHRNKDVILGEDDYTNRCDNAPRNIFSLTGFVLKILKSVAPSPTRAIEHFQDDRNRAIRLFSGFLLNCPARRFDAVT